MTKAEITKRKEELKAAIKELRDSKPADILATDIIDADDAALLLIDIHDMDRTGSLYSRAFIKDKKNIYIAEENALKLAKILKAIKNPEVGEVEVFVKFTETRSGYDNVGYRINPMIVKELNAIAGNIDSTNTGDNAVITI